MKICKLTSPEQKKMACILITKELPGWFGQEEANNQYAEDAEKFPAIAVELNDRIIALLVYKELDDQDLNMKVINIHWQGILPDFHRTGVGLNLLSLLEDIAEEKNIKTLTVETLDPEMKDKHYLKTYAFYESVGFKTCKHFKYDDNHLMVKMSKDL